MYTTRCVVLRKIESKKLSAKTSISGRWFGRSPIKHGGLTTQNGKRTDYFGDIRLSCHLSFLDSLFLSQ